MNDVFICYSPEDENVASDICSLLEDNNYKCWYKKRDYGEGDTVIKITEAIRDAKNFLLIYSKDAKKSNFVTTEVDIAFSSDIPILIFSVDDSAIEGKLQFYLKDKHTIDAYPDTPAHYDELLENVKGSLGKTSENKVVGETYKNDAYICYADEDILTAEAIANALEENGIKCWFKNRDLKVNETVTKISETIENSKSFILVYSDNASKSNYVKTDTDLAISSNIPIISFKIDDIEELDKLSDSHWLDAYPNPEDSFKDLVINTGKIIGNPIDNPKITKKHEDLKKVEKNVKKVEKPVVKSDESPKKTANDGMGKYFKIIAVVVVLLAIAGGVAYFLTSTTTDIASEVNIPAGFHEDEEGGYVEHDSIGYTENKFYLNDNGDYFNVAVVHSNVGLGLPQGTGLTDKTIHGIPGKYNSSAPSFMYIDSKGNLVIITATSDELLNEIIK